MSLDEKPVTLGRRLALWGGSFAFVAVLMIYAHVPLFAVVLGGIATLAITLRRYYSKRG